MDFEQSILKLKEITDKMEDKTLPLDDALKLMKEGIELSKSCMKDITEAKGKLTLLTEELGELTETEFDIDEE